MEITAFKDLADDYLIEQGLRLSRALQEGIDEPDMEFISDLLELLDALNRKVGPVWSRELEESLDWYAHRMDCKRYPLLGGPCCTNVKVKNVRYYPVPEGGVPGVTFLTVNTEGDLVWSMINAYNVAADRLITMDGIHRLQLINGQWMQSHNSGLSWEPFGVDFAWKDDNIISPDWGWSSQKIWAELEKRVAKRDGWDLSQNNYTDTDVAKVAKLIINEAGDKFLSNDGTYKNLSAILAQDGVTFLDTYAMLQGDTKKRGFYYVYNATADPAYPLNALIQWGLYLWDPQLQVYKLLIPQVYVNGGSSTGDDGLLKQDLKMVGHGIGSAPEGYVFLAGTARETVLRTWAVKANPVTYVAPTVSIASTPTGGWVEVGTSLTPALAMTFTQNDAGNFSAGRYYKDGVQIAATTTLPFNHTVTAFILPDGTAMFQGQADYLEGPVKNNNLGEPQPNGHILAGTISSNQINFVGKWYTYWGFGTATTSAEVRALTAKKLGVVAGDKITVTIPAGTATVEFILPDNLKLSKVEYVEAMNSDVLPSFAVSLLAGIESASATITRGYRKYKMTPDAGWIQEVNYVFIVTNA